MVWIVSHILNRLVCAYGFVLLVSCLSFIVSYCTPDEAKSKKNGLSCEENGNVCVQNLQGFLLIVDEIHTQNSEKLSDIRSLIWVRLNRIVSSFIEYFWELDENVPKILHIQTDVYMMKTLICLAINLINPLRILRNVWTLNNTNTHRRLKKINREKHAIIFHS